MSCGTSRGGNNPRKAAKKPRTWSDPFLSSSSDRTQCLCLFWHLLPPHTQRTSCKAAHPWQGRTRERGLYSPQVTFQTVTVLPPTDVHTHLFLTKVMENSCSIAQGILEPWMPLQISWMWPAWAARTRAQILSGPFPGLGP